MPEPDRWERLEGTFFIPFLADSIKFYFEADPPGLDILIESVTMTPVISITDKSISVNPSVLFPIAIIHILLLWNRNWTL